MGDFEKDLQNAFEGAEFAPSPKVWDGVQAGLVSKKKVGIFYMWQTYGIAATIIFLLTMGFLFRDELFGTAGHATTTEELASEGKVGEKAQDGSGENDKEVAGEGNSGKSSSDGVVTSKGEVTDENSENDNLRLKEQDVKNDLQAVNKIEKYSKDVDRNKNSLRPSKQINLTDASVLSNALDSEFLTPNRSFLDHQEGTDGEVKIYVLGPQNFKESIAELRLRWELKNMVGPLEIDTTLLNAPNTNEIVASRTSLNGNLSSGSFNPNGSGFGSSAQEDVVAVNDPQVGSFNLVSGKERQLGSLAVGAGIGIELNRRWLLKLGLRYSQYRYASTSNAYLLENGNPQPLNPNLAFNESSLLFAGEYELTNTIHSISVPVQFGYKLLDRGRFGIMVNAGLGLDYFLSYTIEGNLNFLETRKVDLGETDYLNRFNVNVLTGLEFGYKLNDKFGVSADVFFRQYIPSLGQTDGVAQATPSFFGFGLGVNYFLRKKK